MKKKLLLVGMVLMVVALVLPSPVLAAPLKNPGTAPGHGNNGQFTAQAQIYISNGGESSDVIRGPLDLNHVEGEEISGSIISVDGWDDLDGASFVMTHTADAKLNLLSGKIEGKATGTIVVQGKDGTSTLTGTYSVIIHGSFQLDGEDNPIIYHTVYDMAKFQLTSGTGVFAGVEADGIAFAELTPFPVDNPVTLGGPMTLKGKVK